MFFILFVSISIFNISFAKECGFECFPKEYKGQEHTMSALMNSVLTKINVTDTSYDENGIQFFLVTSHSNETYTLDMNEMFKNFDRNKKTKILVHGWMGHGNSPFCRLIVSAYSQAGDYNLIVMGWAYLSRSKNYNVARTAVPHLGRSLAKFLDRLATTYNIKMEDLHIVGHSLGAHVSGIAGQNIKSGLDPARPLFNISMTERLTKESALYVDVIHTDALRLGMFPPIGHADFYPNGGMGQPGCGTDLMGKCSHSRAFDYFAESILAPNIYLGTRCDNYLLFMENKCTTFDAQMGENIAIGTTGVFYLSTKKSYPFGKGKSSLKIDKEKSFWDKIQG